MVYFHQSSSQLSRYSLFLKEGMNLHLNIQLAFDMLKCRETIPSLPEDALYTNTQYWKQI